MSDENDYQVLLEKYNNLQNEFNDFKELSSQYEVELEENNKHLTETNLLLEKQFETLKKDHNKQTEDFKNYKTDRLKDTEYYEKKIDKINIENDTLKAQKLSLEQKLINIEIENEEHQNKIRELESLCDDLRKKLDATLEENIILHSEHDEYKQEMDEKIQRLFEELEENKNEILSKHKEISQIKNHRDFLLKTAYNQIDDIENDIVDKESFKITSKKSIHNLITIESYDFMIHNSPVINKQLLVEKAKIIDNIDDALARIKQRKEKILMQKNMVTSFQSKIMKQNYKISIK